MNIGYICTMSNVSTNNRIIDKYQRLVNTNNILVKYERLHNKYQVVNSPKVVEIIILLDLLEDMNSSRIDIQVDHVKIITDNRLISKDIKEL